MDRVAERGFGASADSYERGRPGYPPEAIALLELRPGEIVADVGAGTGKLTRELLATGAEVVAVEPVAAMRARLPAVRALDGTAEDLPLADAAVDVVVAGQAFHWFATHRALAEFHRVLRPRGRLALVWNVRDEDVAFVRELTDLLAVEEGGAPRYRDGSWRRAFDDQPWFTPPDHRQVTWAHTLPLDAMVDRFASISFVAALPDDRRHALLSDIRAVLTAAANPDGTVTMPYRTDIHRSTRR